MKRFDKTLNILLIALVVFWIVGKVVKPGEDKTERLKEEAGKSFGTEAVKDPGDPSTILETAIAETGKPTMIFVFTSWCPFCKKTFPGLAELSKEEKDKFNLVGVSVDQDPKALKAFLSNQKTAISFPVHRFGDAEPHQELADFMKKHELRYKGSIPYTVMFIGGKPVAQLFGAVSKEKLHTLVKDAHQYQNKPLKQINSREVSRDKL